jgi:glycosyltransferase involved in cell wall biosynthesis
MPYMEADATKPSPESYRRRQRYWVRKLLQVLVNQERPDVLLVGYESMVWGIPEFARKVGVPCVLVMRGAILSLFDGRFPRDLGDKLVAEARATDLVIACARHLAITLGTVGFKSLKVIPNAIDTAQFCPGPKSGALLKKLGIQEDEIVVLHASMLNPGKRALDLVVSASKALRRAPKLRYLVLGPTSKASPLSAKCRQLGTMDRFRFLPLVDFAEMPEYMRLADIVAMPSMSEGLSRVYLEAQACGRLLLASDIAAAREAVADGETGLLFRTGDIEALSDKTVYAAQDPELRKAIGLRASKRIVAHHRLENAVSEYEAVLTAVIHRHGRDNADSATFF